MPEDGSGDGPPAAGGEGLPLSLGATVADTGARGPAGGSLAAGSQLGRYVILERLGAGGMGVVYAAYDPELDRKIAVKLLHSHVGKGSRASEGHQRLIREAQAMARLNHPNVVAVHDVGERESSVWVAMEFVRGQTIGAWASEEKRPWADLVDAYVCAGRGLAAAHAAGLIHRDFKPDNVMVGVDGRVRVMDFGLARQSSEKVETVQGDDAHGLGEDALSSASSLEESLTVAGALVGTPAYMAPEQFLGAPTDARTDQFSFCVALWEALAGERPFAGESVAAIAFAVCEGKPKSPPPGSEVPRGLFRLLERGMAGEPRERWPSLDVLLEQLENLARPKGRNWLPAVLGVGLVSALGFGFWTTTRADGTCADAGSTFEAIWNDERKERAKTAVLATGLPHAESTWERTARLLDAYAEGWRLARVDACNQAQRTTTFADLGDRQAACFDERVRQFDALVSVFEAADEEVLVNSISAAGGLLAVDPCLDHEYLAARVPPPEEQATREAVKRARSDLAEAFALRSAGRYQAGLELAKPLLIEAEAIGYAPLVAEVQLELAHDLASLREYEQGIEHAQQAYFIAGAQGQDDVATWAATLLAGSYTRSEPMLAENWARHARMSLQRFGERARRLEVALLLAESYVARARSRNDEGVEKALAALELQLASFGEDDPLTGNVLNDVGSAYHEAMEGQKAEDYLERALENRRRVLGPEHPMLGLAYDNLAVHYSVLRPEMALRYAEKALEIRRAAYGPDHLEVAASYFTLGLLHQNNRRLDQAAEAYRKVLEMRRAAHGDAHPSLARPINNLGVLAFQREDYSGSVDYYGQALELYRSLYGETHQEIARTLKNRGHAYLRLRQYGEAVADLERALAMAEGLWGKDDPDLGILCALLGDAYAGQNELENAEAVLERGYQLRKDGKAPWELAILRTALGEVLWRRGTDRKRAVELVEQAEAWFGEKPEERKRGLARTRAWLDGRREWREDRPTL